MRIPNIRRLASVVRHAVRGALLSLLALPAASQAFGAVSETEAAFGVSVGTAVPVHWDFLQFFSIKIKAFGITPAGVSVDADVPPTFMLPVTGNGGATAPGNGMVRVDGSTQYVDAMSPGSPGYLDSGGAGGRNHPVIHMHDAPLPNPASLPLIVNAVMGSGVLDPGTLITSITFEYSFTTYFMWNGIPAYAWKWKGEWTFDMMMSPPRGDGRLQLVSQQPLPSMTANEQLAAGRFASGNYQGAPRD
jgi:hypothetical protein